MATIFPGGRMPPSTAGRDACRYITVEPRLPARRNKRRQGESLVKYEGLRHAEDCSGRQDAALYGRHGCLPPHSRPALRLWGATLGLMLLALFLASPAWAAFGYVGAAESAFAHPGLLHGGEDLARLKRAVATRQEPTFAGFEVFQKHAQSQSNYVLRGPLALVGRNPSVGNADYDSDANAAFQCAVMWAVTGERAYADKSKEILNAWSATLKAITGRDAVLMAGLGPFKMVNAAEIIRYTDAGWSDADIRQTEKHFREVIYPVIQDFAPFANGNWDAAAIKTVLAIGVFCNDRAMFERGLRYYVDGAGDGRLTHYVINAAGQCQESGRDQQHTQLGLAHLGDCCEIAWQQGLNLYGYADNLLLRGFEYTARYNLGETVPFVATLDRTGKYQHSQISTNGRGRLRAVHEQVFNHYVNRMGLPAPFTQRAAEQIRPEGPGQPGADHPGFGTLLFTRPAVRKPEATAIPVPPAALIADGAPAAIKLSWVASVNATHYTVKRATGDSGFEIIARNVPAATCADTKVKAGVVYRYVVSAANSAGESPDSAPTAICAGLPKPWTHQDVGAVAAAGSAAFDGGAFTLEGAGGGIGGTSDQFQFVHRRLQRDGAISARFVPQTSSQFTQFGLVFRQAPDAAAATVALLVSPQAGPDVEAPGWRAQLIVRNQAGAEAAVAAAAERFAEPMVTFGRLTGQCWLKLERSGNTFRGFISADGETWTGVGAATNSLSSKLSAGLAVSSRLPTVPTVVVFDRVTVRGK
jgi:hypothetical protein